MNLLHALMAVVMLSHAAEFSSRQRQAAYAGLFRTLIFTVACKSNLEALELVLPALTGPARGLRGALPAAVLMVVVGGVSWAMYRGREVALPWHELRVSLRDRGVLAALFLLYLGMVASVWMLGHRVAS